MNAPALSTRYSNTAIALHWLIAMVVLTQLCTGWAFSDMARGPDRDLWFAWHRTLGFAVLLLTIMRLMWRFICPPPPLPLTMPCWQRCAAKASHVGFYLVLIALPLTGWVYVSSGNTAATTGITTLVGGTPWPIIPGMPREWHRLSADVHGVLVTITCAMLLLHVAAALKHQFLDKGINTHRMPPMSGGR